MFEHTDLNKCKQVAFEMIDSINPVEVKTDKGTETIVPFAIEITSQIDLCKPVSFYIKLLKKHKVEADKIEAISKLLVAKKCEAKMSKSSAVHIDTYKNAETYLLSKTIFKEMLSTLGEFRLFALYVRQQYALEYLDKVKQFVSVKDYSQYLSDVYTDTGSSMMFLDVKTVYMPLEEKIKQKEQYLKCFKEADQKYLMESDELEIYNNLENEVTIYRGLAEFNKQHIKGLSWTLDRNIAENVFANVEVDENGIPRKSNTVKGDVYQAKIKKEDIFAYINGRNEQEVIVDYTKLYDIKPLKSNDTDIKEQCKELVKALILGTELPKIGNDRIIELLKSPIKAEESHKMLIELVNSIIKDAK